jgi:methylated-DNA-protein-cysteine methyltransferase-like protein
VKSVSPTYRAIYRTVKRIPKGKVATYGQVAALSGNPGAARQVGYALHTLSEVTAVPWHRVVNARGEISRRSNAWGAEVGQRVRLEAEGVEFDRAGRIPLGTFQWAGR